MSEEPETEPETGEVLWDAPNQQVVRDDQSPPWEEGSGGGEEPPREPPGEEIPIEEMTKEQLLERAQQLGVSPANNDMTKAELRAGIEAAGG